MVPNREYEQKFQSKTFLKLDTALKSYYQSRWSKIPGILLQPPQPIEQCYTQLALVTMKNQEQKEKAMGNKESHGNSINPDNSMSFSQSFRDEHLSTIEDIYRVTKPISLESLWQADAKQSSASIRRILIVGRAGVGKSTLCQRIAYLHAKGQLWQERFDRVYWLRLTHLKEARFLNQAYLSLAKAIRMDWWLQQDGQLIPDEELIAASFKSEKTLIILDAFDEVADLYNAHQDNDKLNPVGRVLKEAFKQRNILLTTRSYGVPSNINFNRKLENMGFSNKQIENYINNQSKGYGQVEASNAFYQQLKSNVNLWGISHIPLNLNLLCQLHFNQTYKLHINNSLTLTQIYVAMCTMLLRYHEHQKRGIQKSKVTKDNLRILLRFYEKEIRFLERLAFEGIQTGRLLIDKTLLQKVYGDMRGKFSESHQLAQGEDFFESALEIGFLKGIGVGESNLDRSYYFIHLTFQEFLAAHYIVRGLNEEETGGEYFQQVLNFIEKEKYRPQYRMVFRFASGLLCQDLSELVSQAREIKSEEALSKFLLQDSLYPALCYFWDAIKCSPQDLNGIQKIDLWVSCLDEAKIPGTEEFDWRIRYQDELFCEISRWLRHYVMFRYSGYYIKHGWFSILSHPGLWPKLGLFKYFLNGFESTDEFYRTASQGALSDLCVVAPDRVLANSDLMRCILAGLKDKVDAEGTVIWCAWKSLTELSRTAPYQILSNPEFVKVLKDGFISKHDFIRRKSQEALAVLCANAHSEILAKPEMIKGLVVGMNDDQCYILDKANDAMVALCIAAPHKVLANSILMKLLSSSLKSENEYIISAALKILTVLCKLVPMQVLNNFELFNGLKKLSINFNIHGFGQAQKALAALCYKAPNQVLANTELMECIKKITEENRLLGRKASRKVLSALYRALPNQVFADLEFIAKIKIDLRDTYSSIRGDAFCRLAALCAIDPHLVFDDIEFMAGLKVGLNDESWIVSKAAMFILAELCVFDSKLMQRNPEFMTSLKLGLLDELNSVAALHALTVLCRNASNMVLHDSELIAGLKVSLAYQDCRSAIIPAQNALTALCSNTTYTELADLSLLEHLKANLTHLIPDVRYAALHGLTELCRLHANQMLTDSLWLNWLKFSMKDDDWLIQDRTQQALAKLCVATPYQVLHNPDWMAGLMAGLKDNRAEYDISGTAKVGLAALAQSICADDILSLSNDWITYFIKSYFQFDFIRNNTCCITLTSSQLTLQIGSRPPTTATANNKAQKEKLRLILRICEAQAKKVGLPLSVFRDIHHSTNKSVRMLDRPKPHDVHAKYRNVRAKELQAQQALWHPYSLTDSAKLVSHQAWVISLLRKPKGRNPRHVFLLIEGREEFGETFLCKLEMLLDEKRASKKMPIPGYGKQPVIGYGYINIEEAWVPFNKREKTLSEKKFLGESSVCGKTWNVSKAVAQQLIQLAKLDKAKEGLPEQLRYFIAGERSVFASLSSDERKGHSCFTWALKLLKDLNCRNISIEYNFFAYADPCEYLPEPKSDKLCLMM